MNIIDLLKADIEALNSLEVKGVKNCYAIVAICNDLNSIIQALNNEKEKGEEEKDVEAS